ncbi:MAG TPA: hypothetical protein VGV61_08640 [Thermoanaerobaculia bacterium]|jgi:hypothetical protein|nr:hypothetical protein [Thermoanaerobaculia bacterium]
MRIRTLRAPLHTRTLLLAAVLAASSAARLAAQAQANGPLPGPLPLFPADNWWNHDVSAAPLDPGSAAFIDYIGRTSSLHPDFGGDVEPGNAANPESYGFPYASVPGGQPLVPVTFVEFGDESDAGAPGRPTGYPIPSEAKAQPHWIEGGWAGDDGRADGDRHLLIVDRDNRLLYELYHVAWTGGRWEAGSGAVFKLTTNDRRTEGWTSADAAGLAIFPGLVRYDEVFGPDPIRHAFRLTVRRTNGHVWPASHTAGGSPGALPLGARLRLKASKDISGFPAYVQKIFQAMKTYGVLVADNGSDGYVQGTYDRRWDNDVLNPAFAALEIGDFEVVKLGWNPSGGGGGGGGGGFHPLPLCHLLDTRARPGEGGGPPLAPNGPRTLLAVGRCGVPAGAQAIAANVSVLQAKRPGTLQLYAEGATPGSGLELGFRSGRSRFNGQRVPLAGDGAFTARAVTTRAVQLLVDVVGYW